MGRSVGEQVVGLKRGVRGGGGAQRIHDKYGDPVTGARPVWTTSVGSCRACWQAGKFGGKDGASPGQKRRAGGGGQDDNGEHCCPLPKVFEVLFCAGLAGAWGQMLPVPRVSGRGSLMTFSSSLSCEEWLPPPASGDFVI